MGKTVTDNVFQMLATVVVEILNPLVPIALALFVSVGYLLTLWLPVDIDLWVLLLVGSVLCPALVLAYRAKQRRERHDGDSRTRSWRLALPLLPFLVFVPLFVAELDQPGLQIANHGDLHVGYIHNLLQRPTPPDNIFLIGQPANYYWLYHAFLAALVELTGAAPPLLSSAVNILAILSSLLWLAQTISALGIAAPRSLALGLVTIAVYCAVNATGVLNLAERFLEGDLQATSLGIMLLDGSDRRLHSTMGKVMNFTSMTLAMMCFTVALHSAVAVALGQVNRRALALATSAWLVSLAIQPVVGVFMLIVILGGLLLTVLLVGFGDSGGRLRPAALWSYFGIRVGAAFSVTWLVVSLALTLPLLHYLVNMTSGYSTSIQVSRDIGRGIAMLVAATLLYLPLFALQTVYVYRRKSPADVLIQIGCVLGILLSALLVFPEDNQYKFVFCVAMMLAISGFLALRTLMRSGQRNLRIAASLVALLLVMLTFARIAFVKAYYDNVALRWSFGYDGRHIDYYGDEYDPAPLQWLRSETPVDAIVMLPLDAPRSTHLVHERRTYVRITQGSFTAGFPQYPVRIDRLKAVYSDETAADEYRRIIVAISAELPGEDLYAVVSDAEIPFATMLDRGAQRVFTHPAAGSHVYWLNP